MVEPLPTNLSRRRWLHAASLVGAGTITAKWLRREFATSPAGQPDYRTTIETAGKAIRSAMDKAGVPSASIALIDGQRIVWQEAFGQIDTARKIATSSTTMFAVGSISKLIAAIAALILADRGKLSLDIPIAHYLPSFHMTSGSYEKITTRMLLIHSSGLSSTDGRNLFTQAPVQEYAKQVIQTLSTTRLKYQPGEMAVYCNDDYTLLESIICAISEKSYPQFIEDEVFTPLNMTHSRFPLNAFSSDSYAAAYLGDAMQPQEYVNAYASGGLYSTPVDLAQLASALMEDRRRLGRTLFSPQALSAFLTNQSSHLRCNPLCQAPGLGWDSVTHPAFLARGIRALHKDGQTAFYSSQFFLLPKEKLALIFTGSSPDFGTEEIAVKTLLDALAEKGISTRSRISLPLAQHTFDTPHTTGAIDYYASNYGLFRVQSNNILESEIAARQDQEWHVIATLPTPPSRERENLTASASQQAAYARLHDTGRDYLARYGERSTGETYIEIVGQRIEPKTPISHEWQQRAGRRWLCVNDHPQSILLKFGGPLFTLISLSELPGYLFASYKRSILQIIKPTDHERAEALIQIPGRAGSNVDDVFIQKRQDEEWLRFGSLLYRPWESVPNLAVGTNTFTMGLEELAEWRCIPHGNTVSIRGAHYWHIFGEDMELNASGRDQLAHIPPSGKRTYLMLFADAGTEIQIECSVANQTELHRSGSGSFTPHPADIRRASR